MPLTRADKLLIAIVLVAAIGGIGLNMAFGSGAGAKEAQVYKEGKLVETIRLRPGYHQELRLGGTSHFNLIEMDNGRIRVEEADCPDQICVKTGWLSVTPQQIVCLPYRVVIKIVAGTPGDIDEITK